MSNTTPRKPVVVMLLTRQPFTEQSGRAAMLRRRITQMRAAFDVHLIVPGRPSGTDSDAGITFLPMASTASRLFNMFRLFGSPLQTWLYFSQHTRGEVARIIRETGASAVYVDMLRLAPLVPDLPAQTAYVQDFDDVLSERYRLAAQGAEGYSVLGFIARDHPHLARLAGLFARPVLSLESSLCARAERTLLKRCDLALLTSPHEAGVLRAIAPDSKAAKADAIIAAPPVIVPYPPAEGTPGRRLIFLGNMRYAENILMLRTLAEAARRLQQEGAWPGDAVIEAVGDHDPALEAEFDPQVFHFLGRVPDLATLTGQGVFLAPVIGGTGVKLKVLEGMALGCPVVTTPKGCEGIDARRNRDFLIARDADSVLETALALRGRDRLKTQLARNGRAYVERAHAPTIDAEVSASVEAAIARASARPKTA